MAAPAELACVWPLPFAPMMSAGATTDQAGGYTDFTMLLQRGDDQQRIANLQFKTPEGLLGMISAVPLCEEPQAASGECPAASQIGHTVVNAGPGPYPFTVPQAGAPPAPIYLTGPYDGAPFGLSIVVPVVAGPFNLGTVTVRGRVEVDRHTSQLTITTSALPTILDGIPADLRAIDAVIDRPGFMFNPTSCAPMSFSGTATSVEGATAPLGKPFPGRVMQSVDVQAEPARLDLWEDFPLRRGEPGGEDRLPDGQPRRQPGQLAVEHQERQSRTSQAAPLQAHDAAESLPSGCV